MLTLLSVALAAPQGTDSSFCSLVNPYLPSECNCTDITLGFQATCQINFLDVDVIGAKATVAPCGTPSQASLEVFETDLGVDCKLSVQSGKTYSEPVPGLVYDIPHIGSVGVYAKAAILGNPSALTLKLGLDGCASVVDSRKHKLCGSQLTHHLPIWILSATLDFGDICDSQKCALAVDAGIGANATDGRTPLGMPGIHCSLNGS